jgi:methylmalonyl-CoA mutase
MNKPEKLFEKFPPVTTDEWETKIREDLMVSDTGKLNWNVQGGFEVRPYYRQEDLKELGYLEALPATYPFVRGNKTVSNNWEIRQDILAGNPYEANKKALLLLEKGVTSLGFICESSGADLSVLLSGIPLESVPVHFHTVTDHARFLDSLVAYAEQQNTDPEKFTGSLDHDPLSELLFRRIPGYDPGNWPGDLPVLMVRTHKAFPLFRLISIRADMLHDSGATPLQELAFSLSAGAEYLTAFTDAGLPADIAAQHMQLHFAMGTTYFMEVAKLRAARILWARMTDHYPSTKPCAGRIFIHSSTSRWNQSACDPHTNILRGTGEAMSAVIGGTDSLEVIPYDTPFRNSNEFSERIARNIQIILKEEAYFDKVIDPGAGSYYIEQLTDSLTHQAWQLFLEIEAEGGYLQAVRKHIIQDKIKAAAEERYSNVSLRKEILLGTNQYPDFNEKITGNIDPEVYAQWTGADDEDKDPAVYPSRGSLPFEALRLKTEQSAANTSVFILPLGNPAMRRTRAAFACNFFACGGFTILDHTGFGSVEEALAEVIAKLPAIVVLCSADDEYPEIAGPVMNALKDKTIVVIAGYPKNHLDNLRNKGIEHFIHLRSNLITELEKFQELLGIKKAEGV